MTRGTPPVQVTEWLPGQLPRDITFDGVQAATGVVCFMVSNDASSDEVFATLRSYCPELGPQMVEDLLSPDHLPRVNEYGGGTVRKVSAFGAHAEPAPGEAPAGTLVFELVEFLAGDGWLIVCCHQARSFADADRCTVTRARGCGWLLDAAQIRWVRGSYESAGDLGILLLYQLTCTYSRTRRTLLAWLERWELDWYRGNHANHDMLVNLRGLAAEFRARLNALNQPGDDAGDGWFTDVENTEVAERADRHIDRSLDPLDRLSDMLRSSFELLHSQRTAEQLQLQRIQADRTDRLQEKIEKITSIFLVPTLVAGFFGANTALPGGNETSSWLSFEIMVVTMVVGALVAYFGLAWFREHERRELEAGEGR